MTEGNSIVRPPSADEADLHYVRCFFGTFFMTAGWRESLAAQKAYEEIAGRQRLCLGDEGNAPPLISVGPDAFGNSMTINVRELKAMQLASGRSQSDLNYAMQYSDMLGKMRYSERIDGNNKLLSWVRSMMRQGQQIIHPGSGGMQ
jgi:hypothetical protein